MLVVSGPVTLAEAPRWREALLATLAEGKDAQIDLSASGPWDLAGLQLVVSAIASWQAAGRSIALEGVPDVFRTVAEQASLWPRFAEVIAAA